LIPGMLWKLNPFPPGVGSGKVDTPCERMQREKASPAICDVDSPEVVDAELPPQAATSNPTRATAVSVPGLVMVHFRCRGPPTAGDVGRLGRRRGTAACSVRTRR